MARKMGGAKPQMKDEGDEARGSPTPTEEEKQELRDKILHLLSIYPVVSPTMLQGGVGPYVKPAIWRPILRDLIEEGKVVETQQSMMTPKGRYNTYTKIMLPGTVCEVPNSVLED